VDILALLGPVVGERIAVALALRPERHRCGNMSAKQP
jgi:hypothetical protein